MTITTAKQRRITKLQRGVILLEALIGILIFSIGVLGLMGLQAMAIKNSGDAKYRADAAFLANQIIGQMWSDRANLAAYAHKTGGANCEFSGSASANANVTSWLRDVKGVGASDAAVPGKGLPGYAASRQQILVGANNVVTVTICWQAPQDTSLHNYVAVAQING